MSRLLTPRTLLRTVLSLALLGFLLWRIDLDRAAEALRDADYVYVVPALALFGLALIDLHNFPTGVFWGLLGLVAGGLIAVVPLSHLQLNEGWTCRGVLARLPEKAQDSLETAVPHFIDGLAVFKQGQLIA